MLPILVAKILATKFGFVPDWLGNKPLMTWANDDPDLWHHMTSLLSRQLKFNSYQAFLPLKSQIIPASMILNPVKTFGILPNQWILDRIWWYQIDGLVQERRNSIADALELRLSCTNPSKYSCMDKNKQFTSPSHITVKSLI